MKKILLSVAMLCMALGGRAETQDVCQGWPANYGGVMLQGFWWDSYDATKWTALKDRAGELSQYFDLIWVPNSGTCSDNPNSTEQGLSMGYDPCFWLSHNSCFGTEAELRDMIQAYKNQEHPVGIIEDVVINHKKGRSNWCDFTNEPWTEEGTAENTPIKWSADYREITCNDDCNFPGSGYVTKGGYDTGDDFPGFRDLDHTSELTRANVKYYLNFLLNDLGYAGFRYDLVKGYAAQYIMEYNDAAQPRFSVGEYWDDQTSIQNWIMNTGNRSAAFDFPLKYKINQAISNGDYSAFNWKSFTYDPQFSQYSVTFADNHDSGREDHSKLVNNWSAANAFLLASPGTPCIWFPHYEADRDNIRAMILARKACGITNTNCRVNGYATDNNSGYVMESFGSKGSLYVLLGQAAYSQTAPSNYTRVAEGNAYKFYSTNADFATVKVSPNGGSFTTETMTVTLTPERVKDNQAWYRIGNGEENVIPTTPITISAEEDEDVTLYWRAIGGDNVEHSGSATFTRRKAYNTPSFGEDEAVGVFFETDARDVYFYAWGSEPAMAWDNSQTPNMTRMGMNNAGKLVYKWTGSMSTLPTGLLFVADGKKTADFDFVNHGYYSSTGLSYHMGSNTVYYDNSVSQWDKVYYYAWDNQGRHNADWPGVEVTTKDDRGYYQVSVEGYTSIIFNDPNATGLKQTEDLTVEDGKVYKLEANTVAFDNSNTQWSKVYYYAFTDDEVQKTKWPGEQITTPNSEGKYEVSLQKEYTNVIFNDGNGGIAGVNQTEDLKVDGKTHSVSTNTVRFDNTVGWEHVCYYAFNVLNGNDRSNMTWPGVEIPATRGLYEVTLPEGYNYVIFDNGDKNGELGTGKTADLMVENGKIYTISSPSSVRSVVLLGSFNGWSKENVLKESPENTWTYLLNLSNTTEDTEFKLLVNGNQWLGYSAVTFNAPDGWIAEASNDDNILLKNSTADYKTYQVTISWTPSTDITSGWTVKVEGVDLRYSDLTNTIYFDNSQSAWSRVNCYTYTDDGTWKVAWPGEELANPTDGVYKVTLHERFTKVIFNNGSGGYGNETSSYDIEDGKVYDLYGSTFVTVYFEKPEDWGFVKYYVWNDNGDNGWPGKEITAKDYETASGGYYKAVVNSNYSNIIFNCINDNESAIAGVNKTKDLLIKDGSIYRITDGFDLQDGEFSSGNAYYPQGNDFFYPSSKNVEGYNVIVNDKGHYTCDLLVLEDGMEYKNDVDFTANAVSYVRFVNKEYKWGSIILPFAITSNDALQYYTLKSFDNVKMVFSPVDEVPANTPAVYKILIDEIPEGQENICLDISKENTEVEVKASGEGRFSTEPITDWTMCGTYKAVGGLVSGNGTNIYFLANDELWLAEVAVSSVPFRAWFETSSTISSAKFRIEVEGEPEGIQTIEEDSNNHVIVFDLMGRQSNETRKGLLIKNGKIVFMK